MINTSILKNEILLKYKTFMYWVLLWVLIAIMFAPIYEPFKESFGDTDLLKNLASNPLFESFGISEEYLATVENFVAGEYLNTLIIMGGIFYIYLASNTVAGRIDNKTISLYISKNISRFKFIFTNIVFSSLFIFLSNIIILILTYLAFVAFTNQEEISIKFFVYANIGVSLIHLLLYSLGLFLSLIFDKSKALIFGVTYLILSWLFAAFATFSPSIELINYLTPFKYIDFEIMARNEEVSVIGFVIVIFITIILLILSSRKFSKQDIYV